MLSAINASLSGLAQESKTIQASANSIANASTSSANQGVVDQVSLSGDATQAQSSSQPQDVTTALTNLDTASYGFKGDLISLKVQNDTEQSLLNIFS